MKRKNYRKGIVGICLSLLLLSGIAAPQMLAAEVDDPYAYVPINETPTEDTMIGTTDELTMGSSSQADTSSTVSEYNLASENWDELLNAPYGTTSEDEMLTSSVESESSEIFGGWLFAGNESSDGGLSKIFIVAIIAFALGAIGISFFVYSQFIYKAKLRRKAAESGDFAEDDDWEDEWREEEAEQEEPEKPKMEPRQPPKDPFGEQVVRPADPSGEPEAHDSALTKEDEEKLKEVDWDKFFGND